MPRYDTSDAETVDGGKCAHELAHTLSDDPIHDGSVISNAGDAAGPASSTDHAVARFDGTTGKLLQDTAQVTIDDSGHITLATNTHLYFRDTDAYVFSGSAGMITVYGDSRVTIGKAGDIELGDYNLRVMKPDTDEKIDLGTSLVRFHDGFFSGVVNVEGGVRTKTATPNVTDPPTSAQLITEFGTPAAVGDGWMGLIDDNNDGLKGWLCISLKGNWWTVGLTKAI